MKRILLRVFAAAVLAATFPGSTRAAEAKDKAPPKAAENHGLGAPLVDHPDRLKRLDPAKAAWVDRKGKRVVMIGRVCQRNAPLELFACMAGTKEHEAILSIDIEAFKIHAALLAVGAEVGSPVKFRPKYVPAKGTRIEIAVVWKDPQGKQRKARAQDWILDIQTNRPMTQHWVFAGSKFHQDEQTGRRYYQAQGGDFICVSNFPSAMLDLPIESSGSNDALMFKAFTKRIPPLGAPVTMILTPQLRQRGSKDEPIGPPLKKGS